jgi:hypothetical protein
VKSSLGSEQGWKERTEGGDLCFFDLQPATGGLPIRRPSLFQIGPKRFAQRHAGGSGDWLALDQQRKVGEDGSFAVEPDV